MIRRPEKSKADLDTVFIDDDGGEIFLRHGVADGDGVALRTVLHGEALHCDGEQTVDGGHLVGDTFYLIHPPYLTSHRDTNGDGVQDLVVADPIVDPAHRELDDPTRLLIFFGGATMSCFMCGKHRPRSMMGTRKVLGKAQVQEDPQAVLVSKYRRQLSMMLN